MRSIREFQVPPGAFAARLPGQNAFILKATTGRLSGIDLYLANSCAASSGPPAFRVDRQLPSIIEPEDLSVDVFITTHSHACHADPETIRRIRKNGATRFLGPFDSLRVLLECEVPANFCQLIHSGETIELGGSVVAMATFALPTDDTDLNHTGMLVRFACGLTFYDTAYSERL